MAWCILIDLKVEFHPILELTDVVPSFIQVSGVYIKTTLYKFFENWNRWTPCGFKSPLNNCDFIAVAILVTRIRSGTKARIP